MIQIQKISSRVRDRIDKHTAEILRKFDDMGANTCPDIIRLENCEYVAELFAIEREMFGLSRSSHDREIVLRVCDQFQRSGIPALQEWANGQLTKQKSRIEQEIEQREKTLMQLLQMLERQEATACH